MGYCKVEGQGIWLLLMQYEKLPRGFRVKDFRVAAWNLMLKPLETHRGNFTTP